VIALASAGPSKRKDMARREAIWTERLPPSRVGGSPFTRDDAPLGSARPKGASRCTQWPHCVQYENVQGARRVTSIVPGVPKNAAAPTPGGRAQEAGAATPDGFGGISFLDES
jgi:hypothetical protein